ncbi:MAG TPA: hypothetical protein VLC53_14630, partial [Myxococcota bacterium]|nr:hypothetical protein [Myxococcota bacterium]
TLHRERLQRYFLFVACDPDVASALQAKDRFEAFARHRGLPVPAALAWHGEGPGTVRGTRGAVLVKPSNKVDWNHSALCRQLFGGDGKALAFASGAEAAAHPLVAASHGQLTFQEYVPGGDRDHWSFHGFADEHGEVLACFVGRKVRSWPAVTGESAFIEIAHDDGLEAAGLEAARRCPLKGFFKIDFKRDAASGRWLLLEINARCNLWHYLAAANGLNLMRIAYDYLVDGARPPARRPGTRYRWLALGLDWRAGRSLAARGELTRARWAWSVLASRNVYSVFAWSDPGPWSRLWTRRIGRRIGRGPTRMAAAFRQWRSTAS